MPKSRTAKALIVIGIIFAVVVVAPFIITIFVKESGDKIGIVEIEGTIIDSKSAMDDIVRFKEDENIKGVIVRINSPGGGAAASQEIHREVKKLREKKKVFVRWHPYAPLAGIISLRQVKRSMRALPP
jgi:protease-4